MAAVQQRVLNWLYSVLTSEYQDINHTYQDVAKTLSHYSSLTPKTEVFTYESGTSALLLNLSGTLPVTFRGTTYRFPISLWIPYSYPKEAPLVYVTPTDGMVIRAGQHVDPQGKVYHPYLVGWAEFWDKSNIVDFLAILRDIFAKEPPVMSRQQRNTPVYPPQPTLIPPPVPPHPPDIATPPSKPSSSSGGAPRAPPPPPKQYGPENRSYVLSLDNVRRREPGPPVPPGAIQSPIQNQSLIPSHQNGQLLGQSSLRYETAPPISHQPSQQVFRGPPYSPPNPAIADRAYRDPHRSPTPVRQYSVAPPLESRSPVNAIPQSHSSHQQTYPGQSPQWHRIQQSLPVQAKPKPPPPPDLIDEPLTSPVPSEATLIAPPIPLNPEKDMLLHSLAKALYTQRQHSLSQTSSSLPGLRAQRTSMLHSLTSMNVEVHALESLSALLTSNTSILHASLREADTVITSSQGRAPPDVDEILVAPTVVGNQLYELVCEERSLSDALFVLSRAVERGRVGASVFAKATRGLAREWYLKKALVKKIGKGMGLMTESTRYGR